MSNADHPPRVRARRVAAGGAPSDGPVEGVIVAPDRTAALRLRGRWPRALLVLAGERLPFADGALEEIVDEHATGPAAVAEDARAVRAGGAVVLVGDGKAGGGLSAVLGGLWRRPRRPLSATDASAWLLAAGCEELTQTSPRDGVVVTEGRVRGLAAPATSASPP